MSTDEARWIALARDGDRPAFRRLVDLHARALYATCHRITRDAALAEVFEDEMELVHEAGGFGWGGE